MQGRITIREIKPEEKVGGLILPESAKDKSLMRGVIVSCGTPTPDYDCSDLNIGVEVLFVEYASAEIPGENGLRFIRYEDIQGIYE